MKITHRLFIKNTLSQSFLTRIIFKDIFCTLRVRNNKPIKITDIAVAVWQLLKTNSLLWWFAKEYVFLFEFFALLFNTYFPVSSFLYSLPQNSGFLYWICYRKKSFNIIMIHVVTNILKYRTDFPISCLIFFCNNDHVLKVYLCTYFMYKNIELRFTMKYRWPSAITYALYFFHFETKFITHVRLKRGSFSFSFHAVVIDV